MTAVCVCERTKEKSEGQGGEMGNKLAFLLKHLSKPHCSKACVGANLELSWPLRWCWEKGGEVRTSDDGERPGSPWLHTNIIFALPPSKAQGLLTGRMREAHILKIYTTSWSFEGQNYQEWWVISMSGWLIKELLKEAQLSSSQCQRLPYKNGVLHLPEV